MTKSDDLVKRLRGMLEGNLRPSPLGKIAADRIEELEAKLEKAVDALQDTTDALEKRVDTDKEFREPYETPLSAYDRARATLEELKGDTDE